MERLATTARRLLRRGQPSNAPLPAPPDDPIFSVLDLGTAEVKAVVASLEPGGVAIHGMASQPYEVDEGDGRPVGMALVSAAEAALVAAEDTAGTVPRRVVLGINTPDCTVVTGSADLRRVRAVAPVTEEEWTGVEQRAVEGALIAARRGWAASFGSEVALRTLHSVPHPPALDGHLRETVVGLSGEELAATVTLVLAAESRVREAERLVEQLDLELAALVAVPHALGIVLAMGPGSGTVLDAGGRATGIVVCGRQGVFGAASVPLGSEALIAQLRAQTGIDDVRARSALVAHAAGAGQRSAAGPAAGRMLGQLAKHHAEVWLDGIEGACADLGRTQELPARLLLCGGGAVLPDLRRALAGSVWHSSLSFDRTPAVRTMGPVDVPGIVYPEALNPGPEAVVPFALASAYGVLVRAGSSDVR